MKEKVRIAWACVDGNSVSDVLKTIAKKINAESGMPQGNLVFQKVKVAKDFTYDEDGNAYWPYTGFLVQEFIAHKNESSKNVAYACEQYSAEAAIEAFGRVIAESNDNTPIEGCSIQAIEVGECLGENFKTVYGVVAKAYLKEE